jgi:hypothetical protein
MASNVSAGQNNCSVPPQHRHPGPGAIGTSAGSGEGEHEIEGSLMKVLEELLSSVCAGECTGVSGALT